MSEVKSLLGVQVGIETESKVIQGDEFTELLDTAKIEGKTVVKILQEGNSDDVIFGLNLFIHLAELEDELKYETSEPYVDFITDLLPIQGRIRRYRGTNSDNVNLDFIQVAGEAVSETITIERCESTSLPYNTVRILLDRYPQLKDMKSFYITASH